jgi:hypothetical protein
VFDVNSSKIILGGTGSIKETYGKKIDMWMYPKIKPLSKVSNFIMISSCA